MAFPLSLFLGHTYTKSELFTIVVPIQDFGGEDPSYLSREDFDKLRSGEEEDSLEVGLKSWCIVKLE